MRPAGNSISLRSLVVVTCFPPRRELSVSAAAKVTYRLYECQREQRRDTAAHSGGADRGDPDRPDRRGAVAVCPEWLRRRGHGGDRAGGGGHPGSALPPLR